MNLYDLLAAEFPADRQSVCLEIPGGRDRPWGELEQGSARIANWLAARNMPPGSRVAATIDKSPEGLMLYLATLRAGHTFLPLNSAYRAAELEYFFGNAQPGVVVCSESQRPWVEPLAQRISAHVATLNDDGSGSLVVEAAGQPEEFATVDVRDDALASILYTSGTTGRSKGAMLSHGNLASNALVLRDYWDWRRDDVLLHALPIYHIHGLFVAVNGALLAGARMVWLPKFDAAEVVQCLPRCTLMMGVPTFYVRLLAEDRFTRDVCRRVRLFVSGSAPLLRETFVAFRERTGHTILERYGMSETGMLASNPCRAADGPRVGGTVGRPLPGVSLRIVDDEGRLCPPGTIGTVEVRGPGVFRGYWEMPEKTREEFTPDGYFRTGDLGCYGSEPGAEPGGEPAPDDYISLVGRGKDLIISGGLNVYPKEIESFLDELPGVAESAVVGVPHPDFGEAGVAVVVPQAGAALDSTQLHAALKARIAGFKVPKKVFLVAELPRNAMGKVQKNVLRERFRDVLTKAAE